MFSEETRRHLVRIVVQDGKEVAFVARSLPESTRSATQCLEHFLDTGGVVHFDPAM